MSGAVLSATEMDRTDAELVVAAAAGDHDAFAALYDRYGSRIYDLCAHMLRDRDEAADATAEVFLSASEHLGQLRDPSKCKSWLYAIARNEVYRRTRRRARETVVDMSGDDFAPAIAAPADDEALGDPAATGALLREAALGLDDRDRFVLELTLAGKLDGRELGDALGVSEDTAYQAAHRMRERLARSVGALLVARQGKADCDQLTALLATWDGTFSVLWRKRVARHVDGCETCERRRKAVPAAIFSGSAFAATPIAFLTPPDWLRERVITGARLEPGSTRGWDRNGFPHSPRRRRRVAMIAVLAAALLLLTVVIANVAGGTANDHRVVKVSSPTTTAAGHARDDDASRRRPRQRARIPHRRRSEAGSLRHFRRRPAQPLPRPRRHVRSRRRPSRPRRRIAPARRSISPMCRPISPKEPARPVRTRRSWCTRRIRAACNRFRWRTPVRTPAPSR